MKKIILILVLIAFGMNLAANLAFCAETDYRQIYLDLPVPTFSYMHGIDPGQYYDVKDTTYTPYPLFRLTSTLYFKSVKIPPGYYELTPVAYKGDPYVLFKEIGVVKYIIPVYDKQFVPENFYETHVPQPRLTTYQKLNKGLMTFIGNHVKSAQRKPATQCYLEVNDLDNKFISIIVYYGPYKYYLLLRTVQM